MGAKTLETFRSNLDFAMGGRHSEDEELDNWLHAGLDDLTRGIFLEELHSSTNIETEVDKEDYTLPPNVDAILGIEDETSRKALIKIGLQKYRRLSRASRGRPKYWMPRGNKFLVWQTPNAVFNLGVSTYIQHPRLTTTSQQTILTVTWDRAIHLLALYHGLIDVEEMTRAQAIHKEALRYIASRMTNEELSGDSQALGVEVAMYEDDIHRQET